ncbi:hypothetical protein [Clostridium sp.]|uniref:hypothetical protein n=1 Tax=Clostridium sp. TaxID=1506 RepID=UPI00399124C4
MAQIVRSIQFNDKNRKKKEKMVKSISFKEKERELWEHLNSQLDSTYYIKYLILKDMQELNGEEQSFTVKKEIQNNNSTTNTSSNDYLNLDFD